MKKKNIMTMCLAGILLCSSVALFACGERKPEEEVVSYNTLSSLVSDMKSNEMFSATSVEGVQSNFCLKPFLSTMTYYNELFIMPMNYIETYHVNLQAIKDLPSINSEQDKYITQLEKDIPKLSEAFDSVLYQYKRLTAFSSEHQTIVQGALQLYQYECTDLIGSAYQVAIDIATIEEKVFGRFDAMVTAEQVTKDDSKMIRDYISLFIGKDYYNALLVSSNSKNFNTSGDANVTRFGTFYTGLKTDLTNYVRDIHGATSFKSLESDPITVGEGEDAQLVYNHIAITDLIASHQTMEEERVSLQKAFGQFSFYQFYQYYNCNLNTYNNVNEFISIYYGEIKNYYNSFIHLQMNYIKSVLIG